MDAKQFLKEKGISNSDFMDSGVADLIETLLTEYQALQLQQCGVKRCFSDDHIGVIARNIAKEYAFENEYMYKNFEEAITKGMKIGRKVIQQNNA